MKIKEGSLEFDFNNNLNVIKFDKPGKDSDSHCLSHCMKAVDFIIEPDESDGVCWFIEVKDYLGTGTNPDELWLLNELRTKFRDTLLYRWAEEKTGKQIKYLCLVEIKNFLIKRLRKKLKEDLPTGIACDRWQRPLAEDCIVVNIARWNSNFCDLASVQRL